MLLLEALAEARIEEAIQAGEFDDLPGSGKPLPMDDDALVPVELRMAYRVLRNAGFVPAEIETRREIRELHVLLSSLDDDAQRSKAVSRLAVLEARLEAAVGKLCRDPRYRAAIVARFARR